MKRIDDKPLKLYQNILITVLIILSLIIISFIGLTIYYAFTTKEEFNAEDVIISFVCFVLLLAFVIVEIINTFKSKKNGSLFLYRLLYDEENIINKRFFIVTIILSIIFFLLSLYTFFVVIDINIPSFNFILPMELMILSLSLTFFIDCLALLIYPKVAHLDKSYK